MTTANVTSTQPRAARRVGTSMSGHGVSTHSRTHAYGLPANHNQTHTQKKPFIKRQITANHKQTVAYRVCRPIR